MSPIRLTALLAVATLAAPACASSLEVELEAYPSGAFAAAAAARPDRSTGPGWTLCDSPKTTKDSLGTTEHIARAADR